MGVGEVGAPPSTLTVKLPDAVVWMPYQRYAGLPAVVRVKRIVLPGVTLESVLKLALDQVPEVIVEAASPMRTLLGRGTPSHVRMA